MIQFLGHDSFLNRCDARTSDSRKALTMTPPSEAAVAAVTPSSTGRLRDQCVCIWDDCRDAQEIFTARLAGGENELRGGRVFRLDLAGDNPKKVVWRKAVVSNLGISEANISNMSSVPVARHHWSPAQLEYFEDHRVGKPIPLATMKKMADPFDKEDRIKKGSEWVYFHTPNYPHDKVKVAAFGSQDRADRSTTRRVLRENEIAAMEATKEQQRNDNIAKRQKKEYDDLTLEKYMELLEDRDHRSKMAEDARKDAEIQIRALQEKLAAKDDKLKKANKSLSYYRSHNNTSPTGVMGAGNEFGGGNATTNFEDIVCDFIDSQPGESRLQLGSAHWHKRHPEAAKLYFGFQTFHETQLYIAQHFWDVEQTTGQVKFDALYGKLEVVPTNLTDFEQILLVKYFIQSTPVRTRTGNVFGVSRTTVLNYVNKWLPRWAKYGEHLSILPIPRDYFSRERPDEMVLLGLIKNAFLFDGKDTLSETIRKDDPQRRRQNSSKMHASAYRWINFTSNAALSFEHSRAFFARATEESLVQLHGSCDKEKAPVDEWKDYAKANPEREILVYWSGLDDIVSPEEASKIIESDESQEQQEGESRNEQEEARRGDGVGGRRDESRHGNANPGDGISSNDGDFLGGFDEWFSDRLQLTETKKKLDAKDVKGKATVLVREDAKELERVNAEALDKSPQSSPEEFLQQLELHERLHCLYEGGELKKCVLSAYLCITKEFRWALLSHMGSTMVPQGYTQNENEEVPSVYLRLHKIPPDSEGLGDKGFEHTERFFPYFNRIRCPRKLRARQVKQYDVMELLDKRSICTGRYVVEVPYSRLLNVSGLRDTVPYENLRLVPYMLEWGHAEMNLGMPLRKPGCNSGLPPDYWGDDDSIAIE